MSYTINAGGRLLDLQTPVVMGILNATPDSFYAGSRTQTEAEIAARVHQIVDEGAGIIDVGAYSSRPGADDVPTEEEARRLRHALGIVRREAPDAIISVDTFRADVAKMCIEEGGAHIINDISGGTLDKNMFRTVARLRVPYILMHIQGEPHTMQQAPHYDNLEQEVFLFLSQRVDQLRQLGVADIILDPGFGFGKTLEQNYALLAQLGRLREMGLPLLVGVSRKSMIFKLLGTNADGALNGTSVVNTLALVQSGAQILRVHDVAECVEVVKIVKETMKYV